MKKNRKIVKHFFAILYCLAMAIPLFSVVYYQIDGLGEYTKFQEDNSNGNSQYEDLPQTYYEKVQYQTNELNSVDDLVLGNYYQINIEMLLSENDSKLVFVNDSEIDSVLIRDIYVNGLYFSLPFPTFEPIDYLEMPYHFNSNDINYIYMDNANNEFDATIRFIVENGGSYNVLFQYLQTDEQVIETTNNIIIGDFNNITISSVDSSIFYQYIEKTTEKKQYYFDDAFGKSYLDFAYGGSQSYSQYYQSIEGNTFEDAYAMFSSNENDEYTQMLINYDFLNLMGVDGLYSNNHRGAWYLWLNFYINYLLNMAMIIFMPEVLMIFIQWARDLIYSFTEKVEV